MTKEDNSTHDNKDISQLLQYDHVAERQKKRLIWFGVICIVSLIAVMWVWNVIILIYHANETKSSSLFFDIGEEFNKTINSDNIITQ